jgi:hypothetical protein
MNRSGCGYAALALACFFAAGAVVGLWVFLLTIPGHVFVVPRSIAVSSMILGGPCLVFGVMAFVRALRENANRTKRSS